MYIFLGSLTLVVVYAFVVDGFVFLLMGTLLYYELVEVACLGSTKTATERIRESLKNSPHDDMVSLCWDKEDILVIVVYA